MCGAVLVLAWALGVAHAAESVVVGAALPLSGLYAQAALGYGRGLELWRDEVNKAGGLLGRSVELRLLDDVSLSRDSARLYDRLIGEERAQLLIGPYGSAATLNAAMVAERAKRVLLNATGAAKAVHRTGYGYVFQVAAPYAAAGTRVARWARAQSVHVLFVAVRSGSVAQEAAEALRAEALALGLAVPDVEIYPAGASDYAAAVARARAAGAQAWVAYGTAPEAAEMVKTFRRLDYAPRFFVAQGAAQAGFVEALGQDAECAIGIVDYAPRLATRGNAEFVRAYAARGYGVPDLAAAQAYAAGKIIEQAVARAGSLDQEPLRAALATLETETPLGPYKVDPQTGAQIAAGPVLMQIRAGRRETVWPVQSATAPGPQPCVPWNERKRPGQPG